MDTIEAVAATTQAAESTPAQANTFDLTSTDNIHGGWLAAKALKREGVEIVFTLSGGHIAAIYDGCEREGIRIFDCRHEQAAVHAAEGWARATGKPGVALVTAGPGVTDAVTGIANAFAAPSPVIILTGRAPISQEGMGGLQEMDQVNLVRPITKWAATVLETRRIPELIATAFRQATAGKPGPVFLEFPFDVVSNLIEQREASVPADGYRWGFGQETGPVANPSQIARAAAFLANAERPVIMAGGAVYWSRAWDDLRALAERLGTPVYVNGMGRGVLPPDHPLYLSLSRKAALSQADVAFAIGTPFDFRLSFGDAFGKDTKIIALDYDARDVAVNRSLAVGLVGDIALSLRAILNCLAEPQLGADIVNEIRPQVREWLAVMQAAEAKALAKDVPNATSNSVPIHPLRLVTEIRDYLNERRAAGGITTVVGDGGDIVTWVARVIRPDAPGRWLDPGQLGCLGVGTGFAMAAQLARPDDRVLLVSGDGSFGLNGFEFETMARHKLPIVCIIGNDGAWGQIKHPQMGVFGSAPAAELAPRIRYDKVVEALGGYGEMIERPEEIRPALERAFACGLPACINVITDPNVPYGRSSVVGL